MAKKWPKMAKFSLDNLQNSKILPIHPFREASEKKMFKSNRPPLKGLVNTLCLETMSNKDLFLPFSGESLYNLATNAVIRNFHKLRDGLDEFPETILFDIIHRIYLRNSNPRFRNERVKR